MKPAARAFLLFAFLFPLFSFAADLRVFFFSPTQDGARFRLQCVSSGEANRCPESTFRARGKVLCKESGMTLSEIEPFNCVQDFEKSARLCKYSNGKCSKAKEVPENESKDKEETQLEGIPGSESLPSTEELPNVAPAEELPTSLPEAESMPELKDLPENLSSPAVE